MLSMKGGYIMEERGVIEVKVKHSLSNILILVCYQRINDGNWWQLVEFDCNHIDLSSQGKGEMQTYWLLDADRNTKKAKKEPKKDEEWNSKKWWTEYFKK